jgi:hypothetical protein
MLLTAWPLASSSTLLRLSQLPWLATATVVLVVMSTSCTAASDWSLASHSRLADSNQKDQMERGAKELRVEFRG